MSTSDNAASFTISFGPQFSGPFSRVAIYGSILVYIVIFAAFEQTFLRAFFGLSWLALALPFALDFRGFQFDAKSNTVRNYRSWYGLKTGTWYALDQFDILELSWERFSYRTGGFFPVAGMIGGRDRKASSDSYNVMLKSSSNAILLGEIGSHKSAIKFMRKHNRVLQKPTVDKFAERKQKAMERRNQVEARRFSKR